MVKNAEDWLIWVESTEAVEWTKQLRSAKGLIEGIQRDALEEAASFAIEFVCSGCQDIGKEIRAMKPTMSPKEAPASTNTLPPEAESGEEE